MRVPLYVCPDFKFECEFNKRGMLFIHNDVYRYTPSIHKEIKRVFERIKRDLRNAGVKRIFTLVKDEKTIRYNELFGFVRTGIVDRIFGAELRVINLRNLK